MELALGLESLVPVACDTFRGLLHNFEVDSGSRRAGVMMSCLVSGQHAEDCFCKKTPNEMLLSESTMCVTVDTANLHHPNVTYWI